MVATASIKMDELLSTWLGSDIIYETVMRIIESQKESSNNNRPATPTRDGASSVATDGAAAKGNGRPPLSPKVSGAPRPVIPPFFRRPCAPDDGADNPQNPPPAPPKRRLGRSFSEDQTWDGIYMANREGGGEDDRANGTHDFDRDSIATDTSLGTAGNANGGGAAKKPCIALQARDLFQELGVAGQHWMVVESEGGARDPGVPAALSQYLRNPAEAYHATEEDCRYVPMEWFERVTKELCNLPTFFHKPLYGRVLRLWVVEREEGRQRARELQGRRRRQREVVKKKGEKERK